VKKQFTYQKIAMALLLVMSMQMAYAALSFTGIVDDKTRNNKYSLRSLNNYTKKGLTLNAIKSSLQYKGINVPNATPSFQGSEINSMLQYDNGNTTYIYPYKFKVKVPKFKTPSPSSH
jgi:hypothetical protein